MWLHTSQIFPVFKKGNLSSATYVLCMISWLSASLDLFSVTTSVPTGPYLEDNDIPHTTVLAILKHTKRKECI